MSDDLPSAVTVFTDVNVLAIGLTKDHPVHDEVDPRIWGTLDGPNVLLVPDHPLRSQYVMTTNFDVNGADTRNAVQSLVRSPARIADASATTLSDAYKSSAEKDHDVYDSFVVPLARTYDADYLVTADTDFEELCDGEDPKYVNPIPEGERDEFSLVRG